MSNGSGFAALRRLPVRGAVPEDVRDREERVEREEPVEREGVPELPLPSCFPEVPAPVRRSTLDARLGMAQGWSAELFPTHSKSDSSSSIEEAVVGVTFFVVSVGKFTGRL